MNKAAIKSIEIFLPPKKVYNSEIENKINFNGSALEKGILERLLGIKTRYFASDFTQVSDLACEAGRKIIESNPGSSIDLLIFAAASSDLIEPATANIIQTKLKLKCPVMDVKNACNSFVTAIQVSSAFIESGMYNNILIVNGEKLSEVINYNPKNAAHLVKCLAGYSLGDAGAAVLIGKGKDKNIIYQKFSSWGEYWHLCTVKGGGSMAFRDLDKYYFETNSRGLRDVFLDKGAKFVSDCLMEAGLNVNDISCVVSHQVSSATINQIASCINIPESKFINTFAKYGNTAAATIPLALYEATINGKLEKGAKLMLLGLAAGISLSVQLIEW